MVFPELGTAAAVAPPAVEWNDLDAACCSRLSHDGWAPVECGVVGSEPIDKIQILFDEARIPKQIDLRRLF